MIIQYLKKRKARKELNRLLALGNYYRAIDRYDLAEKILKDIHRLEQEYCIGAGAFMC